MFFTKRSGSHASHIGSDRARCHTVWFHSQLHELLTSCSTQQLLWDTVQVLSVVLEFYKVQNELHRTFFMQEDFINILQSGLMTKYWQNLFKLQLSPGLHAYNVKMFKPFTKMHRIFQIECIHFLQHIFFFLKPLTDLAIPALHSPTACILTSTLSS